MKGNLLKDKIFWYIIGALVVIIGGVVLFVLYKKKKAAESLGLASPGNTTTNSGTQALTSKSVMYNSSVFPLKNGSRGSEVLNLQKYLNNGVLANQQANGILAPLAKLVEDGIWGVKTEEAVTTKLGLSSINETYYKTIILGQI